MNHLTTCKMALWPLCHQAEQVGSHQILSIWPTTPPSAVKLTLRLGGSFLSGAALLCFLATLQKLAIGAPLVIKGYFVPFCFGGLSGACIGNYVIRLRGITARLRQRVEILEALMPLCSGCGKIRVPNAEPADQDSWLPLNRYLSERTGCRFSHGLCPNCIRKLYPKDAEAVLKELSQLQTKRNEEEDGK